MAHRGQHHGVRVQARLFGGGLVDPGGGRRHAKDLDDGAALTALIPAVPAADVVRRNAPLLVGGAGQGDHRVLSGDKVLHLDRVPHGVDVRDGGLHPVVDRDAVL